MGPIKLVLRSMDAIPLPLQPSLRVSALAALCQNSPSPCTDFKGSYFFESIVSKAAGLDLRCNTASLNPQVRNPLQNECAGHVPSYLLGTLVYSIIDLIILSKVTRSAWQNVYVYVWHSLPCLRPVLQ